MKQRVDFTLTQLRYFVTSAERGNISDAAQLLHTSQSAVSMAIRRLEGQLGIQLLQRHRTKGVSLTYCGRAFFADARALLLHAQEVQAHCRERQGETWGKINVAFLHSIASPVVPALLSRLRRLHPQLTVTVHEGTVDEALDLLRWGVCELAVTGEVPGQEAPFTRLASVQLEALVSQTDLLASPRHTTLKELATRPLLVVDAPAEHAVSAAVRTKFTQAGVPAPQVVQTSSIGTLLGLVREGEGFALMPRGVADTLALGDRIVALDILSERPCVSDIGITRLPGPPASKRAKEFVLALCETVSEIYEDAEDEPGGLCTGRKCGPDGYGLRERTSRWRYEPMRRWCARPGQEYPNGPRHPRPGAMRRYRSAGRTHRPLSTVSSIAPRFRPRRCLTTTEQGTTAP